MLTRTKIIVCVIVFSLVFANGAKAQQDIFVFLTLGKIVDAVAKDKAIPLYGLIFTDLSKEQKKKIYEDAKILDRQISDSLDQGDLYVQRGLLKKRLYLWDGALDDFNRAVKLKSKDPEIHFYKSEIWLQKGDRANGVITINNYIKKCPDSAKGYFQKALVLQYIPDGFSSFKNRCMEAIPEYGRSLAIEPHYRPSLILRGHAYYSTDQNQLAIADYKTVLTENPDDAFVLFLLGLAYEEEKDLANACESFTRAREKGKEIPERFIRRTCK